MFNHPMNGGVLMSQFHNQAPPAQHQAMGQMAVHAPNMHHAAGGAPHPGARLNNHMAAAADRMRASGMGGTGATPHMPSLPAMGGGAMLQAMAPRLPTALSTMGGMSGSLGGLRMPRP